MWDWGCRSLFLLAPFFCFDYNVNKGGHLGLLPHPVEADEREAKLPISDFPSDKCPVDAYPPSWSVRTQKLLDCLQYLRVANIPDILCGEQQEDSVFSGWQSCKRFYDSLFDWWRCSLAVGLYAEVIGARYNRIFFLLFFFFCLWPCCLPITDCQVWCWSMLPNCKWYKWDLNDLLRYTGLLFVNALDDALARRHVSESFCVVNWNESCLC